MLCGLGRRADRSSGRSGRHRRQDRAPVSSKTSKKKKDPGDPIHIVSAFAARQRLVLGQVKVGEKSNEIVAIPKLLRMLELEGAVVTIDAMGCQRDIAQTIIDKKADYILALKGNQGTLKDDVKLLVDEQKTVDFKDAKISRDKTVDGDHGQLKPGRSASFPARCRMATGASRLARPEGRRRGREHARSRRQDRSREVCASTSLRWFCWPPNRADDPRPFGMIENGLHWVLDMVFRDDECRVRTDNAPANLATLKHMAYNVMQGAAMNSRPSEAKSRRLGRRLPRNPHRSMIFADSPGGPGRVSILECDWTRRAGQLITRPPSP